MLKKFEKISLRWNISRIRELENYLLSKELNEIFLSAGILKFSIIQSLKKEKILQFSNS